MDLNPHRVESRAPHSWRHIALALALAFAFLLGIGLGRWSAGV